MVQTKGTTPISKKATQSRRYLQIWNIKCGSNQIYTSLYPKNYIKVKSLFINQIDKKKPRPKNKENINKNANKNFNDNSN